MYNISQGKKIHTGFVAWFQFISFQSFPLYECYTLGVDKVKHHMLVVIIEIVDIAHYRRPEIPMIFQRLFWAW
jgi:hypothetical protein